MRYASIVAGHLSIPQILTFLGLSLILFPKWQSVLKLSWPAVYSVGMSLLIIGLLGLLGIVQI